ncbi:hypothetical protein TNIN_411281 [Trichonephila inaurata madagascariensis]|uniref:Uncharacterized protein n=1 Tax=Trichonephila inaurata madagascariensis TaxID=2747483 RepID=A0A8X7BR78_9ARAC|nr:hypothetical protein TNIN_411281 [Trichonephila inaurata madagascariensis]
MSMAGYEHSPYSKKRRRLLSNKIFLKFQSVILSVISLCGPHKIVIPNSCVTSSKIYITAIYLTTLDNNSYGVIFLSSSFKNTMHLAFALEQYFKGLKNILTSRTYTRTYLIEHLGRLMANRIEALGCHRDAQDSSEVFEFVEMILSLF